jgi:hypothetical protein
MSSRSNDETLALWTPEVDTLLELEADTLLELEVDTLEVHTLLEREIDTLLEINAFLHLYIIDRFPWGQ